MNELPPEAEELLAQARRAHDPSEAERQRVLASLHSALGIAAPPSSLSEAPGASAGSPAASAGKLFGWKAGKVLLATVAIGTAAAVLPIGRREPPPARAPKTLARPSASELEPTAAAEKLAGGTSALRPAATDPRSAAEHDAPATPSAVAGPLGPVALDTDARAAAEIVSDAPALNRVAPRAPSVASSAQAGESTERESVSAAPTASSPTRRTLAQRERASARRRASAEPSRATSGESAPEVAGAGAAAELATAPGVEAAPLPAVRAPRELELIRRALTKVRDGAPSEALTLLDQHAEQYPSGAFATEREGLRVVALCASGRTDQGRAAKAAFLLRAGSSPIATRVRRACAEEP